MARQVVRPPDLGRQAAVIPAQAEPAVRRDLHMHQLTGKTVGPGEQPTAENESGADSVDYAHVHHRVPSPSRPKPRFPKSTDLSVHSLAHLLAVENELNSRPRHILNDQTPAELFAVLLASENPPVLRR
jgi:hypothetical protein